MKKLPNTSPTLSGGVAVAWRGGVRRCRGVRGRARSGTGLAAGRGARGTVPRSCRVDLRRARLLFEFCVEPGADRGQAMSPEEVVALAGTEPPGSPQRTVSASTAPREDGSRA